MKILMICPNPVFKYKDTGAKWIFDELAELCSCHNDVIFLNGRNSKDKNRLPNNGVDGGDTYFFRQWTLFGDSFFIFTDINLYFLTKLKKIVKKEKIDLLFITYLYGIISASIIYRGIPIIYDSHLVTSDTIEITLGRLGRHLKIFRYPIIKKIVKLILGSYIYLVERSVCRRVAHIKAISGPDRQRFIEKYGIDGRKITTISPYVRQCDFREAPLKNGLDKKTEAVIVVFHGSYNHSPNYDAFELILNYIAPEVGKRNSNIQFVLGGTNVPVFERGNVKSLGFVEDIQKVLANSDIAIVPLLTGEGIKTKILNYMAVGLPIISTRKGIQAIEAEDGRHAIILDNVDRKFIDAILDLAGDVEKREILGRNALELARAKYSWESMQTKMDEMLANIKKSR